MRDQGVGYHPGVRSVDTNKDQEDRMQDVRYMKMQPTFHVVGGTRLRSHQ